MVKVKNELMWATHNVVAHPVSEICYWIGFIIPPIRRFGNWIHDLTIPDHEKGDGRG